MINAGAAHELAADLLRSAGLPADRADRSARLLVTADSWGIGSHGLMRLPRYLDRFAHGGLRADAELLPVRDRGPVVAYDGQHGLGHWQLWQAARTAAERAADYGLAAASVGNSSHCGALGLYVAPALERGLIAIAFSTGPAVMPAPGTASPLLSTSPIAAGIPDHRETGQRSGGHAIIDLATSAAARGRIAAAARAGTPIPDGWAVDASGSPTTDPVQALAGMLAPMGGAKGFALAFLVEALTGGSVGPALATDVPDMFDPEQDGRPQRISHLIITIDPEAIDIDRRSTDRLTALNQGVVTAGGRVPGRGRTLPDDLDPAAVIDISAGLLADLRDRAAAGAQKTAEEAR